MLNTYSIFLIPCLIKQGIFIFQPFVYQLLLVCLKKDLKKRLQKLLLIGKEYLSLPPAKGLKKW